ncbi:MAG: DUF4384 domain-containing protein [Balneolaceae bacterium]
MKILFCSICLLVALSPPISAQENKPQVVQVHYQLVQEADQSLIEVKEILLNDARVEAVQKVSGVRIESIDATAEAEMGNSYFNSFRRLMRQSVRGRIIDEEKPIYTVSSDTVTISFKATVQQINEDLDPYFKISLSSNKRVYNVGEAIQFQVTATKDAYLILFSVKEDNSIAMFFPNQYLPNNFAENGVVRVIPNEKEQGIIDFVAQSETGKEYYSELIYAVATKQKYEFEKLARELTYDNDWITLNRWLLELDRDQWVEAYLHIQVFE